MAARDPVLAAKLTGARIIPKPLHYYPDSCQPNSAPVNSQATPIPAPTTAALLPVVIGALIILSGVIAMAAGIPYSVGYGDVRLPIWSNVFVFWKSEEWQHCWVVPLASAFIIWQRREALLATPVRGSLFGFVVIGFSVFCFWAGYRTDNFFAGVGSIWIFIAGGILAIFGWQWGKLLLFPWAFLLFALPLVFLEEMIAFRLRLLMSTASVHLLNFFGFGAVQQGTAILSAPNALLGTQAGTGFSVDVADPCSGIRSLFALTMATALYAFFMIKPIWKQIFLFLCAIPLAIAGNMARILMLTVGTIAFGSEFAIGSLEEPSAFHLGAGFLVFIVAFAGMIGIGTLITMDWSNTLSILREKFKEIITARVTTQPDILPQSKNQPAIPVPEHADRY
jgi:exosortase